MVDFIKHNKALAGVAGLLLLWFVSRYGSSLALGLSAVAVWAVLLSPLIIWIVLKRRQIVAPFDAKQAFEARLEKVYRETGYQPPILWRGLNRSPVPSGALRWNPAARRAAEDQRNPDLGNLVTPHLLATRSALPPFLLWYEEGACDGVKRQPGPAKWLSTVDGNPALGPRSPAMPVFVQALFKDHTELALFETTAEEARKLTQGPYGRVTLQGRYHPDDGNTLFIATGGTPGGVMPQAPRPIETRTTQGSSRAGTGDADAERA
jgi:hypothetical protein